MRNAGDGAVPGGRSSGSSGRRRAGEDEPSQPAGGTSLFIPAYRASYASPAGSQKGHDAAPVGGGDAEHGHSGYGQPAAGTPGTGYSWTDESQAESGGYAQPGYDQAGDEGPAWPEDDLGSPYSWSTDDPEAWPGTNLSGREGGTRPVASNAVRGFPPAPGDSPAVYPPGPFAAWNRGQPGRSDGRPGPAGRAGSLADSSQLATATITPDEFDTDYSIPAIKDPAPGQSGRSGGPERRRVAAGGQDTAERVRGDQARDPGPATRAGRAKGTSGRSAGRGRRKRQPAWLAISTAGVIIAAVAAILVVTIPRVSTHAPSHKPSSTPTPASSSPTPPPGPWGYIASRKTDPMPLTAAELFPASIANQGVIYSRAKQAKGANCRAALIGTALQAAVKRSVCTQTLRATYLSKSAKVMATIGVFNLKNFAAASKAARKAGHAEFVAQLAAKTGPAKAIGQGTGLEEAIVKGHYLVLVWAETTNLTPPKGQAGRTRLTAFMNLLVKRTVNVSLSNRMVDAKPVATS